jgi:hypothetical protein
MCARTSDCIPDCIFFCGIIAVPIACDTGGVCVCI